MSSSLRPGDDRRDVDADARCPPAPASRSCAGAAPASRRTARWRAPSRGSQNGMLTVTCTDATARELGKHVDVALDERRLGDDADRVPVLGADLEAAARQPVRRLERLVAVGDAAEDDDVSPFHVVLVERLAQQRGRVGLDDDLAIEVGAGAEAQVLVRRARVAVGAGVEAAAVGVHAPGEADVGAVVLREDARGCGPRRPPARTLGASPSRYSTSVVAQGLRGAIAVAGPSSTIRMFRSAGRWARRAPRLVQRASSQESSAAYARRPRSACSPRSSAQARRATP